MATVVKIRTRENDWNVAEEMKKTRSDHVQECCHSVSNITGL